MTKSELIQRLAEQNPHLYLRDIEKIVETIFEEITAAMVRGDRVELRGFGTFGVKHRMPKKARNPGTGEPIYLPERFVPAVFQNRKRSARASKRRGLIRYDRLFPLDRRIYCYRFICRICGI